MTVKRWVESIERQKREKKNTKSLCIMDIVIEMVNLKPEITLKQIQSSIEEQINLRVSKELIRLIMKKYNISRKKIRYYGECKDLAMKTKTFMIQRNLLLSQSKKFVSIDETSFGRHHRVVYGYSKKGNRIYKRKAYARVTTQSALCCLDQNGNIRYELVYGGVNSDSFYDFIISLNLEPSTVVILDNCRIHHTKAIKHFAELSDIHLLYTPPYSPWFNPIEFAFSNVKRLYYKNENIEKSFSNQLIETNKRIFEKTLNCFHKN
jgi:transposase